MAGSALRRLMAEYKQMTINPPEGIVAGPVNEENFFEWEALIVTECESGANVDASKMWRDERELFNRRAKEIVKKSLGLDKTESS
ncbi:putative ubiquitin-conjugating enzyme E2 G2-like [Apostichopus japonicus]|uniref:Putative ubiquitin-conjugating enzyme E2 G2-like n=1 Tax=Stichopus japonicus TaxID=307972 RepID=A0A2G8LGM8_STIJA|nr:putative ubiquitin-conjugating enzyme E2 G2-like [Apostichopus japonicus]